jgi:hypothetical protein
MICGQVSECCEKRIGADKGTKYIPGRATFNERISQQNLATPTLRSFLV